MSRRKQNLKEGIKRAEELKKMKLQGMSFGEISKKVGISRQGVQQFIKRYEDNGLINIDTSNNPNMQKFKEK